MNYFRYACVVCMYFVAAILITVEIKNLEEFHFDKFTMLAFVVSAFWRQRLGVSSEFYFIGLIALAGTMILIAIWRYKPIIPVTDLRWARLGILFGSVCVILMAIFELLFRDNWNPILFIKNSAVLTTISQLSNQMSFIPIEEILFRGFLWGFLGRLGWKENKILWAQGLLFWCSHFSRLITPFSYFVALPFLILISSKLVQKSRQLFPAILSHVIINAIASALNLAVF